MTNVPSDDLGVVFKWAEEASKVEGAQPKSKGMIYWYDG